jgi:UDP-2-acetamido-3-amino-2,3-dideoxy-glucuronate N-acetyltransferase
MIHKTANVWGDAKIGVGTRVGAFCDIGGTVGKDCKIQCHVSIPPGIVVENNVFIGPGARFANDKHPNAGTEWEMKKTVVCKGAVIGMGALIGPGITIGESAVIGMGAVVTHDVPSCETWVGNPARKLC